MTRFAIGIGSNQGDRLHHLEFAVERLDPVAISPLYETDPVGGPEQDPFLNAVVLIESEETPRELLDRLQAIEAAAGRERVERWGPRTLDLDIVASDTTPHRDDRLTIPHPRARERSFVLEPLARIWPEAPVADDMTAAEAVGRVEGQGIEELAGNWFPAETWKGPALVAAQFILIVAAASAMAVDGAFPGRDISVLTVVGAAVAAVGLVLALVASRHLGSAMTPNPVPREGAQLVVSGPFRFARHPIYGGVTLVLFGTSLFLGSFNGVVGALVLGLFFWFKSGYEERRLRMRYPGYRAYRQAVHRRLIPFLI